MTQKSIFIFSSRGGGGHVAASEAIIEALGSEYQIKLFNALSDVFNTVDLISRFTKKKTTGEDFYNFVLKKRFFFLANLYGVAGKSYMTLNRRLLRQAAYKFLKANRPTMVVSVIPYFNGALYEACKTLKIPFWIFPTDVELESFLVGLSKEALTSDNFKLALAYKPQIEQAKKWGISKPNILKLGFPVKKACTRNYTKKDLKELKKSLNVKTSPKVISLTLGAAGTSLFTKLAKSLTTLDSEKLEFICCAGRDQKSLRKMQKYLSKRAVCEFEEENHTIYRLSSGNRIHLFGFTKKLPEIMAVSDLVISKSGSLSVSEALHLQKYLLLDHTINSSARFLFWERPNLNFVRSIKKGDGFKSKRDLLKKIEAFLNAPKAHHEQAFVNIHQTLPEAVSKAVN